MRLIVIALAATASGLVGCLDLPPANVPLDHAGESVEILTDSPNLDLYESYGEISVDAIGMGTREAQVTARHLLRNRAGVLHARFVSVDVASASFAWDFSGRTVVTMRGRVFRVKEDEPPARRQ
jgi:hypothetical protein